MGHSFISRGSAKPVDDCYETLFGRRNYSLSPGDAGWGVLTFRDPSFATGATLWRPLKRLKAI